MRAAAAAVLLTAAASAAALASADHQLARVRGDVRYALEGTPDKPVTGRVDLPATAGIGTGTRGLAALTLPDSSVIQIGGRTTMRIGDLDANGARTVALTRGALRFTIRHPQGAPANYVFVTPTSQVAVRGTLAYLVVGPKGDQLYCVDCAAGDVSVRAAGEQYAVLSGQTLNVRRMNERAFDANLVANTSVNNPAIDQFLGDFSPFGRPAPDGADPTGSESAAR